MNVTAPLLLLLLTGKKHNGPVRMWNVLMSGAVCEMLSVTHFRTVPLRISNEFRIVLTTMCSTLSASHLLPSRCRPGCADTQSLMAVWENDLLHSAGREPSNLQRVRLLVRLRGKGQPCG